MATPIFIPTSSGSGSSQDPTYATKAQLTTAVSSVNATISSATTALAIIQKPLTTFSATTGTITSADTILSGISKNAGNISAQSATSIQTFTNKTFGDSLTANAGVLVKGTANQIKVYPTTDNAETSMVFNNLSVGATGGTGWILGQNIFGIGSGTFGIAGGTAGVALQASPTTGFLTIPKTIVFPGAEVRKRISFFDDGDATSQTDHRFNGFGKGNFTHVYQIKSTAESHVFYVATSATTSNEIFRIAGTGAVSCGGTLASGSHAITGALTATTTANITGLATVGSLSSTGNATVGGTLASGTHNITGALTATTTANITGLATVGSLASTGNATVGGTLIVSGLMSAGGGLQLLGGTLSYYEEYNHITAFNITGITSLNLTIRFTRVGRQVSAHVPAVSMTNSATLTSAPALSSTVAFPTRFRSANNCYCFVPVNNDSLSPVSSVGCANITSSGIFEVHPTNAVSVFSINGAYNFGFSSFTATWSV